MMDKLIDEKRIKRFIEGAKEAFKEVDDPTFTFPMNILSAYELATSIEELLKAQEPRVLTLEEIPEYDGAFLIEYRYEVWPMQWALFRLNLTTAYRFIRGDSELGFSISKDFYSKTWRCWTSRPTDEQRKATPWTS